MKYNKDIINAYIDLKIATDKFQFDYLHLLKENFNIGTHINEDIYIQNIFFHYMELKYFDYKIYEIIKFNQDHYKLCRKLTVNKYPFRSHPWIIGIENNECHTRCYKKFKKQIKLTDNPYSIGIHRRCRKIIIKLEGN